MLDTILNMEENVKELEIVSDAEEMAVTLDSEHEEGEISEDDDDVELTVSEQHKSFPHHYPSDYHKGRQSVKNKSATSAVVIYDDRGRTAIFTSPMKKGWDSSSYKRRGEQSRRWQQEEIEKRRQKDDEGRKHQNDNGKENKRSTVARARSRSPIKDFGPSKKKTTYKRSLEKSLPKRSATQRSKQTNEGTKSSPSHGSSSKASKSWSTSSKAPHPYARHTPNTTSKKVIGKVSHLKDSKNKLKENVMKTSDDESDMTSDDSQKGCCDLLTKGNVAEGPLLSSQKQLPRGSFGEMLLKIQLKGKLKTSPQANKTPEKKQFAEAEEDNRKEELADLGEEHEDCYTLDQEDEDELQLRLLALQSSLKVLSDVRREGCQSTNTGNIDISEEHKETTEKETETKDTATSDDYEEKETCNTSELQEYTEERSLLLKNRLNFETELEEGSTKEEINLMLDDLSQSSTRSQPVSSINGLELELDTISTNKSYLDESEDSTRQLATNIEEQLQREMKDLADSNQDPIDMDICDSSPGEDDDNFDEEILKAVGEDISLDKVTCTEQTTTLSPQGKNYPANALDPGGPESFQSTSGSNSKGIKGSSNNFQIPVEWAYMMPPPPPPDQPPNDISNINNWCYDQNMYLQTMQSSYDSNEQYQHYNSYGTPTSDWRLQHPSQWNDSRTENVDNTSEIPESNRDSTQTVASPEEKVENSLQGSEKEQQSNTESSPQEDLKDLPAEHYQAFMSVVLNQQKNSCTSRNLIEVQLTKSSNSSVTKDIPVLGSNGGAILQVNKRSRARRRKRERQKEKIKQLKQLKAMEKLTKEATEQSDLHPGNESIPTVSDEEDEDLLRAQLLIDLSRKKQQKLVEPSGECSDASFSKSQLAFSDSLMLDSSISGFIGHESTPPLSYPSSLESSPRLRPVMKTSLAKMHQQQARIRENSPTHIMKAGMRRGLSDIGGFGLDPKSSRYDFPVPKDSHIQKDVPKFKFPNIKPVIINLESDSDEDEDAVYKEEISSHSAESAGELKPSGDGILSSSIDLLLKSMRNAHKPGTDTFSVRQIKKSLLEKQAVGKSPVQKPAPLDTTPNVVRHLSRTQQVEYRKLKEQLREKEMLQKKRREQLLRQKVLNKKMAAASDRTSPESPQSGDNGGDASDGGQDVPSGFASPAKVNDPTKRDQETSEQNDSEGSPQVKEKTAASETREVIFKGTCGLQIQLPNINTPKTGSSSQSKTNKLSQGNINSKKKSEKGQVKDLSGDTSAVEDEDEEMLRLMVLKTLQKKTAEKVQENYEENKNNIIVPSEGENERKGNLAKKTTPSETLRVMICQKFDDMSEKEKEAKDNTTNFTVRKVVIEDPRDFKDNAIEIHRDDTGQVHVGEVGEWMVLDEVLEEISEGNGENANNGELAVPQTEESHLERANDEIHSGCRSDNKESESKQVDTVIKRGETEYSVVDRENEDGCHITAKVISESMKVVTAKREDEENSNTDIMSISESTKDDIHEMSENLKVQLGDENNAPPKELLHKQNEQVYKVNTQQVPNEVSKPVKEIPHSASMQQNVKNNVFSDDTVCIGTSCLMEKDKMETIDPHANCNGSEQIMEVTESLEERKCKMLDNLTNEDRVVLIADMPSQGILGDKEVIEDKPHSEINNLTDRTEIPEKSQKDSLKTPVFQSTKDLEPPSDVETCVKQNEQTSAIRINMTLKLQEQNGNVSENPSTSSGINRKAAMVRKPLRTKRLLLLKRVEHEYTQKRIAMNEVISQLASLVHEATEEERQRQTTKLTITTLREKLNQMEQQLEDKSNKLKAKMARIRNLQTRITKDREEISQLERKGEMLGKEELGSDYKLPKVLGSPHSKSKDHMRKKQLAHNIDALRQQIGQMYNKNQARLQAAFDPIKKIENSAKKKKVTNPNQNSLSGKKAESPTLGAVLNGFEAAGSTSITLNTKSLASMRNTQTPGGINLVQQIGKTKSQVKHTSWQSKDEFKIDKTNKVPLVKTTKSDGTNEADILSFASLEHEGNSVPQQSAMNTKDCATPQESECQKPHLIAKQYKTADITGKIDEMNMLCPYDLLGRCNDDSCWYQHVRDPRHISSKTVKLQKNKTVLCIQTSVTHKESVTGECVMEDSTQRESVIVDSVVEDSTHRECMIEGHMVEDTPHTENLIAESVVEDSTKKDQIEDSKPLGLSFRHEGRQSLESSQINLAGNILREENMQVELEKCVLTELVSSDLNETYQETDTDTKKCEYETSPTGAIEQMNEKGIEVESMLLSNSPQTEKQCPIDIASTIVTDIGEIFSSKQEQEGKEGISDTQIPASPSHTCHPEIAVSDSSHETIDEDSKKETVLSITSNDIIDGDDEHEQQQPDQSLGECSKTVGSIHVSSEGRNEIDIKMALIPEIITHDKSEAIVTEGKNSIPKRCTPRKRTRNSDVISNLAAVSESSGVVTRRTRRRTAKTDVTVVTVAKKNPSRQKSTPSKTSPRRGGRKTRGVKR